VIRERPEKGRKPNARLASSRRNPDIRIEKRGDYQVVTLLFGKVQAGERRFLADALYLGNPQEKQVTIDAVVRADQFPSPLAARLEFQAQGSVKNVDWNELKRIISGQFFGTDKRRLT
jgi:hypothetical protein